MWKGSLCLKAEKSYVVYTVALVVQVVVLVVKAVEGILLGNNCLLQVKLLWWRKRFSQPALEETSSSLLSLTVAYVRYMSELSY